MQDLICPKLLVKDFISRQELPAKGMGAPLWFTLILTSGGTTVGGKRLCPKGSCSLPCPDLSGRSTAGNVTESCSPSPASRLPPPWLKPKDPSRAGELKTWVLGKGQEGRAEGAVGWHRERGDTCQRQIHVV